MGKPVTQPVRRVTKKLTDSLILEETKLQGPPFTPPRDSSTQSRSRNEEAPPYGSSFGKEQSPRSYSPQPRVETPRQQTAEERLAMGVGAGAGVATPRVVRGKSPPAAAPPPPVAKPVLVELGVGAERGGRGEKHIYYVARGLQLVEPVSGRTQWEQVLGKAVATQIASRELALRVLNLPNRNWVVEQAAVKEQRASKELHGSSTHSLEDLKVQREEIALQEHFNWLVWAMSRFYFGFDEFRNMRAALHLPPHEAPLWREGFLWKGVYFRLLARAEAKFLKQEMLGLKYAALELDTLQQSFSKKLNKRKAHIAGGGPARSASKARATMITHTFLPLLSYGESGAFLLYGTPCLQLKEGLDPTLAAALTRASGLAACSAEHFYHASPLLKLEPDEPLEVARSSPSKTRSPAALQDLRKLNEDSLRDMLQASLFSEMPILQQLAVCNILPLEVAVPPSPSPSPSPSATLTPPSAKKYMLVGLWRALPDIHAAPEKQLLLISAENERDIEIYPYPKLEALELPLAHSLLSGAWERNLHLSGGGSGAGAVGGAGLAGTGPDRHNSHVQGGYLKNALNPAAGLLQSSGGAMHLLSGGGASDHRSLPSGAGAAEPRVSQAAFRAHTFMKSGWGFKLLTLRGGGAAGVDGGEAGRRPVNERAGLLLASREGEARGVLSVVVEDSGGEPEEVKERDAQEGELLFKGQRQAPRSLMAGAPWSSHAQMQQAQAQAQEEEEEEEEESSASGHAHAHYPWRAEEQVRGNGLLSCRYLEGAKLKYAFISPRDAHTHKRELYRAFSRSLLSVKAELDTRDLVLNSAALKELLHRRGLNLRYLWVLLVLLQTPKARLLVANELLARAVKKVVCQAAARERSLPAGSPEQLRQLTAAVVKSVFQFKTGRKPLIHELLLELWLGRLKVLKTTENDLALSMEQMRRLKSRELVESVLMAATQSPVYFLNATESLLALSFSEPLMRQARADRFRVLQRDLAAGDVQGAEVRLRCYLSVRELAYTSLARQLKKAQVAEKRARGQLEEEENAALTANSFSGGGLGRGDGLGQGANTLETASMFTKEGFRISFMQNNQQRSHRKETKFQRKRREREEAKGDSSDADEEQDGGPPGGAAQCSSRKPKLMDRYEQLGKRKQGDGFVSFVSPRGVPGRKAAGAVAGEFDTVGGGGGGGAAAGKLIHSPPIDRHKLEKLSGQGDTAKLTALQQKFRGARGGGGGCEAAAGDLHQAVVELLRDVSYFNEIVLPAALYKIGTMLQPSATRSFFSGGGGGGGGGASPLEEMSLPLASYYELPSLEEVKNWCFFLEKVLEKVYCADGGDSVLAEAYCYYFLHLYFQNNSFSRAIDDQQHEFLAKMQDKLTKACVVAPPELYVTMHSLVALLEERKETTSSEINYLCALTQLHKLYGDPRGRGNIGVPWALLPAWKLILLSAYDSRAYDTEYAQELFDATLEAIKDSHSPFPRVLPLPLHQAQAQAQAQQRRPPASARRDREPADDAPGSARGAELKPIEERRCEHSAEGGVGTGGGVLNQSDIEVELFDLSSLTPSKGLDGDGGLAPEGKEPRMHMPFIHWSLLQREFRNVSDIIEALLPVPVTFVNWLVRNNPMMYQCGRLWTPEQQRERVTHCGEITAPSSAANSSVSNLNMSSASLAHHPDTATSRARRESHDFEHKHASTTTTSAAKPPPSQQQAAFKVAGYSQILSREAPPPLPPDASLKNGAATYSAFKTQSSFASSFTKGGAGGGGGGGGSRLGLTSRAKPASLAEMPPGVVYVWGTDLDGQLGLNSQDFHSARASQALRVMYPRLLVSLKDHIVIKVVCGHRHTIALTAQRQLWAWGNNESFQLGLGTSFPKVVKRPVRVEGLTNVEQVSCGTEHSVAVVQDGSLYTWGQGEGGLLGHGDCKSHSKPTKLQRGGGERFWRVKKVVCGGLHTLVLTQEGKVFAWGRAEGGQIGLEQEELEKLCNDSYCILSPIQVKGALRGQIVADIACGEVHSLALTKGGRVFGWGWGENGQLGLGFSSDSFEPGTGGSKSIVFAPHELRFLEGHFIAKIYTGSTFSFFLTRRGELMGAGMNDMSQLGLEVVERDMEMMEYVPDMRRHPRKKGVSLNRTTDIVSPTLVDCFTNMRVKDIACGENHCLAITGEAAENLWSWGQHRHGQLGHGELKKF